MRRSSRQYSADRRRMLLRTTTTMTMSYREGTTKARTRMKTSLRSLSHIGLHVSEYESECDGLFISSQHRSVVFVRSIYGLTSTYLPTYLRYDYPLFTFFFTPQSHHSLPPRLPGGCLQATASFKCALGSTTATGFSFVAPGKLLSYV